MENKPREFSIYDSLGEGLKALPINGSDIHPIEEVIHVIEKSALDAANLKIQELEAIIADSSMASGYGESHEAYRYRQIHEAVHQMGGWANFRHWVQRHSKEDFETCKNLEEKIQALEAENLKLKVDLESASEGWLGEIDRIKHFLNREIDALKSENERLKAELLSLAPMKSNFQAIQVQLEGTRRQFDRLAKQNAELSGQLLSLKDSHAELSGMYDEARENEEKLESQNQIYKTALEYAISKASGDVKNALVDVLKSGGES